MNVYYKENKGKETLKIKQWDFFAFGQEQRTALNQVKSLM